ncbi:unnamed protein product [Thelazia callipaeda]|uniref:Centromere protein X n=1 Tax=Thelazia callipaeda TaxID=103827 RepID=A0A0N5CJR0_THECL|nr:unnamed protein product [Thelazia callipaeda]
MKKTRAIREGTVRRCLLLRHSKAANSFSNDIVYILTQIVNDIVKEIMLRSASNAQENCSERVELENLYRILPQSFTDFNL